MNRALTPVLLMFCGLLLGILSAQYLMKTSGAVSAQSRNGWNEVSAAGEDLASTYLAGHFLVRGQVPPPRGSRYLMRLLDDEGQSLRGDCVVSIEGKMPAARWWFIAANDGTTRTTLDAGMAVREASGDYVIAVSSNPVPGNWLAPPGSGSYELNLVLLGVDSDDAQAGVPLPRVKRLGC